ncbi:MAG: hypothetical protein ABJE95_06180 [Byssovorax sp.]
MKWLLAVLVAGASLSALACGGKVVVDASGGGGTSASTTTTAVTASAVTSASAATTTSATTGTGGGECPDPFPGILAPCNQEQLVCPAPGACCPGTAVCKDGVWRFPGPDCQSLCAVPCGPDEFGCNSVCVIDVSGSGSTFRCAQNPCDGTVSCGCATPLCDEKGETCALVSGFTLTCAK